MRVMHPAWVFVVLAMAGCAVDGGQITAAGRAAQLDVRVAGESSIRVTLKPIDFAAAFPFTSALAERR
jgi:hypothetical protein